MLNKMFVPLRPSTKHNELSQQAPLRPQQVRWPLPSPPTITHDATMYTLLWGTKPRLASLQRTTSWKRAFRENDAPSGGVALNLVIRPEFANQQTLEFTVIAIEVRKGIAQPCAVKNVNAATECYIHNFSKSVGQCFCATFMRRQP